MHVENIVDQLPRHPGKSYGKRNLNKIRGIVVHKSGAHGPPGIDGPIGCARYCIEHREWPGIPYTFWIPEAVDDGGPGAYQTNSLETVSYHTRGRNRDYIAIALQGTWDSDGDMIVESGPGDAQMAALSELVDLLAELMAIDLREKYSDGCWALTGHWEHGKPVCPGDAVRQWIQRRRGEEITIPGRRTTSTWSVRRLQAGLLALGFDPGPIDGIRGYRTRAALERFQAAAGIVVDGVLGPQTTTALAAMADRRDVNV